MKICIEINSCRECPHCTNSAKLHDDAFTSAPYYNTWYCMYGASYRTIKDENVIDAKCPVLKGKNK